MANTAKKAFLAESEKRPTRPFVEFFSFLRHNKKWWLTPVVLALVLVTALVLLGGSGVAPFIYSLF